MVRKFSPIWHRNTREEEPVYPVALRAEIRRVTGEAQPIFFLPKTAHPMHNGAECLGRGARASRPFLDE